MVTKRSRAKLTAPTKPVEPPEEPVEPAPPAPDEPPQQPEPDETPAPPAAAPLAAPVEPPPPANPYPTQPQAVTQISSPRHIRIVNAKGEPIDIDSVLVRQPAPGRTWVTTTRVFEETTLPGAEPEQQTRRRILYGPGYVMEQAEYEALQAAIAAGRTAA